MTHFAMRLDMRAPAFARRPQDLYLAGLEMAGWADRQGFEELMLSEHHGTDDNFLPSPLILAAAVAGRTQRIRIRISALVLPLHDPLRVAEDVAVLDNLSGGRIELVVAGGFLPSEFAMFDRSLADRGTLVEEGVEAIQRAWTGEPFEYRGRIVRVTPLPVQQPRPPVLLGGSAAASARRAARIADGFVPSIPELYPIYLEECERLGVSPGEARTVGAFSLFVTDDPDRTWAQIASHALHENNSYAGWYAETGTAGPYSPVEDADELRATGIYTLLTPAECIDYARELGPDGWLYLHPLVGGVDPSVGWQSLELIATKVMPALR